MAEEQSREQTLQQIRVCCDVLDDRKAEELKVLDVMGKSPVTDYMVLATGTSIPHLRALRNELEKKMSECDIQIVGEDREVGSGWVVVDAFDFVIHLFTRDQRDFYRLEALWKDAEEIDVAEPLSA